MSGRWLKVLPVNPSWGGLVSRKGRRFNQVWPPLNLTSRPIPVLISPTSATIGIRSSAATLSCLKRPAVAATDVMFTD
jgi:hypothetical protein